MIEYSERAILLLASYDFESLQITLKSLHHTLNDEEKVIIILNGKSCFSGEMVERIAREWASEDRKHRFVVRPLCSGEKAYWAIKEVCEQFEILKNTRYICKIDDDIIPLNKGWMNKLSDEYERLSALTGKVGFVTGLINNNNWGFAELIDIFNKKEEYEQINNYPSRSGNEIIQAGEIGSSAQGTVWQYPYLAYWLHQWSSLDPEQFIRKTQSLSTKEIPGGCHYSIGCIFFEKSLWMQLDKMEEDYFGFDELAIHNYCLQSGLSKWAVMSEPMIHIFYYTQRFPNKDILLPLSQKLGRFFNDNSFDNIRWLQPDERIISFEERISE